MKKESKKKMNIVISIVLAVIIPIAALLALWVMPVRGKVSAEEWKNTDEFTNDYCVAIEKKPDKDFEILTFSDTQFNDAIDYMGIAGTAYDEMKALVEKKKPDLIIVMGDATWAAMTKVSIKQFVHFMDKFQIPWAAIMGNHEDEKAQGYFGNVDCNWVCDQFMKSEYCIMKKGPNNIGGVGNYIINIEENGRVIESLILMDSHSKRYYEKTGEYEYDHIYPEQIEWYKWAVDGLKQKNGHNKNMLFIHIPLNEYKDAYEYWEESGFDKSIGFGEKHEEVCAGYENSGMFDVIRDMGATTHVFAAHDHLNNYGVLYQGVNLIYTMKTGDRCSYWKGNTGGTRIIIGEDIKVEHDYIGL